MPVQVPTLDEIRQVVREEIRAAFASREAVEDLPLTTAQAALVAGVKPKTIRKWAASGRLRCTREGQEIRALRVDVLRAKTGGGVPDPAQWAAEHAAELRRRVSRTPKEP